MINVVFDLSNMFHRSMYIVGGFGSKGYTFGNQDEIDQLMRKVAMDIALTLRQINPSRIVFAADSKSWRKKIEIIENEGYKGNRVKSDFLNWDNIYAAMQEFTKIASEKGMISTRIPGAEADDLMCLWRDKFLYDENQHVVLVSGDEDIRQLADYNIADDKSVKFATILNPFTQGKNTKKLFAPKEFMEWLDADDGVGDIFNRGTDLDKESFISLLKNAIFFEEIFGPDIAMKKIFCGDDGDNVPSMYTWEGKTNTGKDKTYRITASTYKKIINKISPDNKLKYSNLVELESDIYKVISEISKHTPDLKMVERIQRQIKLVVLARSVFPEEIIKEFDELVQEQLDKKPDQVNGWYVNTLLAGTRYIDENYQRKKNEASIFQEIDKISQSLF